MIGKHMQLLVIILLSVFAFIISRSAIQAQTCMDKNEVLSNTGREIVVHFDCTAAGQEISHLTLIDEQYADWGIHFNNVFYTGQNAIAFANYSTNNSLNQLCTFFGTAGGGNPNCILPIGGTAASRLIVDLDFPVEFASIEGRTRNDGVYDADGLKIEAYDVNGTLLGIGENYNNNVPAPYTVEGVLVAEINATDIRRLVINPIDTDAIDSLTLRIPEPNPPDLDVKKDDGRTTVSLGETVTYIIEVNNTGEQDATGVVISDTIPTDTTFSGASDGGTPQNGIVTWPAFSLAAGTSVTRSVTVQVNPTVTEGTDAITNTVAVTDDGSKGPDPTPGNNTGIDVDGLEVPPSNIGDRVWFDSNGDGVQDGNEEGISGLVVSLLDDQNNTVLTDTTDANGVYGFNNVNVACYTVRLDRAALQALGVRQTFDPDPTRDDQHTFCIMPGQSRDDVDFGYQRLPNACIDGGALQRTFITGIGMGSSDSTDNPQTYNLTSNINSLIGLEAQVIGRIRGRRPPNPTQHPDSAIFTTPNETVTINTPVTASDSSGYSFETSLQPTNQIKAELTGNLIVNTNYRTPRALVVYETHKTNSTYSNITAKSLRYVSPGNKASQIVTIPELQAPATLNIQLALADKDDDDRPVEFLAEAGGLSRSKTVTNRLDMRGDQLTIVTMSIPNVPQGTDSVKITMESPAGIGDSGLLTGINISYPCTPDTDADSIPDSDELIFLNNNEAQKQSLRNQANVGHPDTDGDNIPNFEDPDDDGDGVDTINEDIDGNMDPQNDDTDGDGTPNHLDNDDDNDGQLTKDEDLDNDNNPANDDFDHDGTPNYLDGDDDNDGLGSLGDADPYGPDDDNDGLHNDLEGSDDPDQDQKPNHQDDDSDGDNILDKIETAEDDDFDGKPNFLDDDSDNDFIKDSTEGDDDTDSDGKRNFRDEDSDNDGRKDRIEGVIDSDKDATPDYLDEDSDNDNIPDSGEWSSNPDDPLINCDETLEICYDNDVDGDEAPNATDEDSDGDGATDKQEGTGDSDEDGIPNFLDADSGGLNSLYLPLLLKQ